MTMLEPDRPSEPPALAGVEPVPPVRRSRGRALSVAVRLAVTLVLLAWVVGRADWTEVLRLVRNAEVFWLVLFLLITPLQAAISVWKWQPILAACGHRVGFWALYGINLVSQFYNNLLPSSVGGDVVRTVMLARRVGDPRHALASITVERFTGLLVLVAMAGAAVLIVPGMRRNVWLVAAVGAVLALTLGLLVCVVDPRTIRLGRALLGRVQAATRLIDKAERFQHAIRGFRHRPLVLTQAMVWSVVFHLFAAASIYLACRGLGEDVSLWAMVLAVPVVLAVATLPISISGIGLSEWAFMVSFGALGLSPTIGLTAGLLLRAKGLIWSCGGYLLYTLLTSGRDVVPADQMKPQMHTDAHR